MALFSSATHMIDNRETESIQNNVDIATTIVGLARYYNVKQDWLDHQ